MNDESQQPVADLRKNLRAPIIIQKVHLQTDQLTLFGYTKNISRSGMFIATTRPVEPGDRLDLEFRLPHPLNANVRCSCEIVWIRPSGKHLPFEPGIGLKFVDLPKDVAMQIDLWVKGQPLQEH